MGREHGGRHLGAGVSTRASKRSWDVVYDLDLNKWHHLVLSYNGSHTAVHVNGATKTSSKDAGDVYRRNGPILVGSNGANGEHFVGEIDDVSDGSRPRIDLISSITSNGEF